MGGRWVKAEKGETFIAPAHDHTKPKAKPADDDEPPGVSFSVPL